MISRGDDSPPRFGLNYSHWTSSKYSVGPISSYFLSTVCSLSVIMDSYEIQSNSRAAWNFFTTIAKQINPTPAWFIEHQSRLTLSTPRLFTQRISFLSRVHNVANILKRVAVICNFEVRPLLADASWRYLQKRRAIFEQIRNVCNYGVKIWPYMVKFPTGY